MKQVGHKQSIEISQKQINALYRAAKERKIKLEKWVANEWYHICEYYGYDDNQNALSLENKLKDILQAFFDEDENLQNLINEYTEESFNRMGLKAQRDLKRDLVEAETEAKKKPPKGFWQIAKPLFVAITDNRYFDL